MMPKFDPYERVRILVGRFEAEGVPVGSIGYVIEQYPDGALEVEVSDPATGVTISIVVVTPEELDHAPRQDVDDPGR
jgi:Domain of unknown function (DUF4926)